MKDLFVYHEKPPVCQKYFSESLRSVRKLFNFKGVKLIEANKISNLSIQAKSPYFRILLTHESIKTHYNCQLMLDGIGVNNHNIALVKYQSTFLHTTYLMAHEIAHLLGASHCLSASCLMGVKKDGKEVVYAWHTLATKRKLSRRLFCPACRKHIRQNFIATDVGG